MPREARVHERVVVHPSDVAHAGGQRRYGGAVESILQQKLSRRSPALRGDRKPQHVGVVGVDVVRVCRQHKEHGGRVAGAAELPYLGAAGGTPGVVEAQHTDDEADAGRHQRERLVRRGRLGRHRRTVGPTAGTPVPLLL